ncbi:MAG: cupin domain-containing protein, partial [Spirochaetales bacterium]|nr:cupin domain-containing protein [Spirochaetales bacterium]
GTSHIIRNQIRQIYPDYADSHILLEPIGRNTAPAIAYSCLSFNDDDIVAVLSADAYIAKEAEFNSILTQAAGIAADGYIATLGIVPDSPKTGYGYIKRSEAKIGGGYKVDRFVEKPDLPTAQKYLRDGSYYWNAGIFVFRVSTFWAELSKYAPSIAETSAQLRSKISSGEHITADDYAQYNNISIDYAVMEHSDRIAVVEADVGWNDIGSFKSLYDLLPHNADDNACRISPDKFISIDSQHNCIYGGSRTIVTLGVEHLIIADTPDALLIADTEHSEQIKQAVNILKDQGSPLIDKSVVSHKPWGQVRHLYDADNTEVTQITVSAGCSIPAHYHKWISENITIVSGTAQITINGTKQILNKTESLRCKQNEIHLIANASDKEDLQFIETKTAAHLDKDDIFYV